VRYPKFLKVLAVLLYRVRLFARCGLASWRSSSPSRVYSRIPEDLLEFVDYGRNYFPKMKGGGFCHFAKGILRIVGSTNLSGAVM